MVLVNYSTKEIVAKIVYYGPGLCGKTTNLQYIYTKLNPKKRGKIISLATEADRTLFFDFLPVELGVVGGFKVRFQLYTVPGQVFYSATRKLVLKGTDAVAFVADSQADVLSKNLESVRDMQQNMVENSLDPATIPIVFQYNKRDLDNVLDVGLLDKEINYRKAPWFTASAVSGDGVMETFKEITRLLIKDLKRKHSMVDSDIMQELPPEVFERKEKPKEPEAAPAAPAIEMGSSIRDEGSGTGVDAGSLLNRVQTIALADTVQAEVFFDNVRKGESAEEAMQKATHNLGTIGPAPVYDTPPVVGERELTPEEIDFSDVMPVSDEAIPEMVAGVPPVKDMESLLADEDIIEPAPPVDRLDGSSVPEPFPEPLLPEDEAPAKGPLGAASGPSRGEVAAIIRAVDRLEKEVQSLSRAISEIKTKGGPSGSGGLAVLAARIDGLEKGFKEAVDGQDRLLLSILEAVRDTKNTNSTAHENIEEGLRYLVEKQKEGTKTKRRWF